MSSCCARTAVWVMNRCFTAASRAEFEQVLSSMPLRVWRSDEVQDLARTRTTRRREQPQAASGRHWTTPAGRHHLVTPDATP